MPKPNYYSIEIDGQKADIDPAGQVPTVDYDLEDDDNFEKKESAMVLGLEFPSTLINDQIHNTLHNPSVIDNTPGQVNENFKSLRYIANGLELFIGKYLVKSVLNRNKRPEKYKGNAYGLNGDWVIDLKEKTILDFVSSQVHIFDAPAIMNSWSFDGQSEQLDYVYAPVRYLKPFGVTPEPSEEDPDPQPLDDNVLINDLKPSISIYWLLYRAFKSVGYRIVSTFMDTEYYRRSVLPWTWGGFDFMDDSRWEPLKFLAAQETSLRFEGDHDDEFPNLNVRDDLPGTYDNNNTYTYTSGASPLPFAMVWTYPPSLGLGKIRVNLSVQLNWAYKIQQNSDASLLVFWYKNGVEITNETIYAESAGAGIGAGKASAGYDESFFETDVEPGDYIACRPRIHLFESDLGFARQDLQVVQFSLNFVKLTIGAEISFKNYPKFKNYKWLDLLRGEIDMFDLIIQTDPIRKEVYIEPAHEYEINGITYPGYHNRQQLDWSQKVDHSIQSELELYSDHEREFEFVFKEDTNDGGLKKVQDRNQTTIGMAKYVLPERFKTEKKRKDNRFYSAVMHYEHRRFGPITGISPQLIAMIPENISNTSGPESENTYNPKRAWYKGNVSGVGGWKFNGIDQLTLPYLFAVNYKTGGENDPVLSYGDQLIGGTVVTGLMKKFFLQRMAIRRHGRRYNPISIMLNGNDVANFLHRESIIIDDIEYVLKGISGYEPVNPGSTSCRMWVYVPKGEIDLANSYPSIQALQEGQASNSFDVKYWPHILLASDVP